MHFPITRSSNDFFAHLFWTCDQSKTKKIFGYSLNSISPDLWRRSRPRARTRFWHCWWLFFSWSKIFSFPFIKHAFSHNTVFNSFFEEKSNIFMLGYRDQLKKLEWRHCGGERKIAREILNPLTLGGNRTLRGGQGFLFRRGRGREMNRAEG